MKYLKNFKQLINEDFSREIDDDGLRTVLMNIFRIFKTKDDISEIFDDEDELVIATDLYDSFIDTRELLELNKSELQSFADNLGVGGEPDILVAIIEKMYEDKFKRKIKDDVESCIKTLREFIMVEDSQEKYKILSKRYLTELEKIKNNL